MHPKKTCPADLPLANHEVLVNMPPSEEAVTSDPRQVLVALLNPIGEECEHSARRFRLFDHDDQRPHGISREGQGRRSWMTRHSRKRDGAGCSPASRSVAAVAGCSTYIGTTSKSFLREAEENTDPNIRYVAYAKLGSPSIYENQGQKDEAVRMLIAKLEEAKEPVAVRAVIVRSLGNLGDHRARPEIIKAVNDFENAVIRVEACRALGKVGQPEDATMLARIMTVDKLEDCRIAAIEGLGCSRPTTRGSTRFFSTAWITTTPRSVSNVCDRCVRSPARTWVSIRPHGGAGSSRRFAKCRPRPRKTAAPRSDAATAARNAVARADCSVARITDDRLIRSGRLHARSVVVPFRVTVAMVRSAVT